MSLEAHNVKVEKEADGRIILVDVSGVLNKYDYELFVPEIDEGIDKHGSVRILFDLIGFHGWTLGALFEDTKFAVKHYRGIERIAFIGDKRWEQGMAAFCKPFTKAKITYFTIGQLELAKEWLREGVTSKDGN